MLMSVTEDGDLVIVEGNHVEIQNKRSDAISQPLMCVGNVLREAEDIVTDKGAPRAQPLEGSEVLIDEVNVEYSPHHSSYPIEIVVRHNTVVSESRCNEDEQSESSSLLHSNVHNYVHDIKDSSSMAIVQL
ncbi:hypothetical protein AB6A40_008526 [Gnathostoma spinigerum]|uniref:Zinc finger protein n=1 Tax=Gnathostoma spinigerum TaxID=75299 RepID=A0ABD6EYZ0_9BILA